MTSVAVRAPSLLRRTSASVELAGITKRFAARRAWSAVARAPFQRDMRAALIDVTLQVSDGEFLGLLGPNGAGKTTLFKILSTLVLPDEGRAFVMGHDVVRDAARTRLTLAPVIADERSLHWRLTAEENLRLFAAFHAIPGQARAARTRELLALVGLETTGRQLVATFSSGMRQRLLVARALLARPRVLLLDEPTRSLDPMSARALRSFLRDELARRHGCTVLLATHNADEAFELCDRVAVLDRGRLVAAGSAHGLAREVGDERYRVWTRDATHPVWESMAERGLVERVAQVGEDDGWMRVELDAPGGLDRAAQILDVLACAGVRVARFEHAPLTLAELIERVVARRGATDA
jgi:ABC-2 type transport system ATP-binding protein